MLRILDNNDIEAVKKLSEGSLLGTRILCYALCYGFDKSFVDFWANENVVVARFENAFTIKALPDADFDELREFIDILGATEIVTDKNTAEALGFNDFTVKSGYRYVGENCVYDDVSDVNEELMFQLYSIISEAIPDSFCRDRDSYLSFLSDYMYRKRRGYSRAYGVFVGDKLVSTAITSAETDDSAIISGVACDEGYRKFGYGKKTVLTSASLLNKENKNVYVIALNDSAKGFYEHIRFEKCEEIAYISKRCKNV